MRLISTIGFAGVILGGTAFAQDMPEGDPSAGLDSFARIPIAPHIGCEPATYLVSQLVAFRDGTREHDIMSEVAAEMTDAEIRAAADWYGAVKLKIAPIQ